MTKFLYFLLDFEFVSDYFLYKLCLPVGVVLLKFIKVKKKTIFIAQRSAKSF